MLSRLPNIAKLWPSSRREQPVVGQIPLYFQQIQDASLPPRQREQATAHLLVLAQRGENERWNICDDGVYDEGGIPVLLNVLRHASKNNNNHPKMITNVAIQKNLWGILAQLCIEKGTRRRGLCIQQGIVPLLVSAVAACGDTANDGDTVSLVKPACDCIRFLCHKNTENVLLLTKSGIHITLAYVLQQPSVQKDRTAYGTALASITVLLHSKRHAYQYVKAGGISTFLVGWKLHPKDPEIVETTLYLISVVAELELVPYRLKLIEHNVHIDILQTLAAWGQENSPAASAIESKALMALKSMSADAAIVKLPNKKNGEIVSAMSMRPEDIWTVRNALVKEGAIDALLHCLERHVQQARTNVNDSIYTHNNMNSLNAQRRCVAALENLVCKPKDARTKEWRVEHMLTHHGLACIPAIVTTLQRNGAYSKELMMGAAHLIVVLLAHGKDALQMQQHLLRTNALELLIGVLRHKSCSHLAVKDIACSLGRLLYRNEEARLRFVKAKGPVAILLITNNLPLDSPVNLTKEQRNALDGFCLFFVKALEDLNGSLQNGGKAEMVSQFINRKGMSSLCLALDLPPEFIQTTRVALKAMAIFMDTCHICRIGHGCQSFVLTDALPKILGLMRRYESDSFMQVYACRCLTNLASKPSHVKRYGVDVMVQVAERIVPTMRRHQKRKEIQEKACRVVCALKRAAPSALGPVKAEVLATVKEAMSLYPQVPNVQKWGERALQALSEIEGAAVDKSFPSTVETVPADESVVPAPQLTVPAPQLISQPEEDVPFVSAVSLINGQDDIDTSNLIIEADAVIAEDWIDEHE